MNLTVVVVVVYSSMLVVYLCNKIYSMHSIVEHFLLYLDDITNAYSSKTVCTHTKWANEQTLKTLIYKNKDTYEHACTDR